MFTVEMVFPPDFPDAPPAVRFTTPLFHPQINGQGVPYLRCLVMWTYAQPKERAPPHPPTHTHTPPPRPGREERLFTARSCEQERTIATVMRQLVRPRPTPARHPPNPRPPPPPHPPPLPLRPPPPDPPHAPLCQVGLFAHDPSPEPATHINPAAAALHFSRSEEERKESKRRARKCACRGTRTTSPLTLLGTVQARQAMRAALDGHVTPTPLRDLSSSPLPPRRLPLLPALLSLSPAASPPPPPARCASPPARSPQQHRHRVKSVSRRTVGARGGLRDRAERRARAEVVGVPGRARASRL